MKHKKTGIAVILLTLVCTVFAAGCGEKNLPQGTVDTNQYRMNLKLDTEKKNISGSVEISFTNHTDQPLSEIIIRNYAASILKEMGKGSAEIKEITGPDGKRLPFKAGDDPSVVSVDLGEHSLQPDEDAKVTVQYKTDVPNARERFGYYAEGEDQYYHLSFCFPVLSVFENGTWNRSPYVSRGESVYTKVSDWHVNFEAPEQFTVAASGEERTENGMTVIEAENIRDPIIVVSNNLEVLTDTAEGVRISYYTMKHPDYPWMHRYNERLLDAAKDSVTLFTEAIGTYPYEELDMIQSFISGGMEYPGLTLIGLPDVNPEHGLLKGMAERKNPASLSDCLLVAHETAHQWFYAAVGNDPYQEPWLDESFANYCELGIYGLSRPESMQKTLDETDGGEGTYYWYTKEEQRERISQMDDVIISRPYKAYKDEDYGYIVYDRGADFLFELQEAMGDEAFFAMMRDYYSTYILKEVKGENFTEMVYKYDASKKVKDVLRRYLI